jgi:hypothetical protein
MHYRAARVQRKVPPSLQIQRPGEGPFGSFPLFHTGVGITLKIHSDSILRMLLREGSRPPQPLLSGTIQCDRDEKLERFIVPIQGKVGVAHNRAKNWGEFQLLRPTAFVRDGLPVFGKQRLFELWAEHYFSF